MFVCMCVVYSYADSCRIHIDAMNKDERKFFKKIYLSLYLKGCVCERELETEQRLQYIDPHSYGPSALCLSRSPGLPNRRPGGSAFCWLSLPHFFSDFSDLQLNRVSRWVMSFSTTLVSNFSGP